MVINDDIVRKLLAAFLIQLDSKAYTFALKKQKKHFTK